MFFNNLGECEGVFYGIYECNNCNRCILNNSIDYLNLQYDKLLFEFNDLLRYDILDNNDKKDYQIRLYVIKHKIKIFKDELDKIDNS